MLYLNATANANAEISKCLFQEYDMQNITYTSLY